MNWNKTQTKLMDAQELLREALHAAPEFNDSVNCQISAAISSVQTAMRCIAKEAHRDNPVA